MRNRAQPVPVETKPDQPILIDATDHVAGRLATVIAKHLLEGQRVIVVNSERARVLGSQEAIKARYHFKTHVGNERKGPFPSRMPDRLLKRTVRGMLPIKLPKGRAALKRLRCFIGVPEELSKSKTTIVEEAKKPNQPGMSLLEVSRFLGKKLEVVA